MALKAASEADRPEADTGDPFRDQRIAWSNAIESNRDQWGRPKVMLPDGSKETGYRRASSYGSPLENSSALDRWKLRQVARGVARRKALVLAITRAETGLDGGQDEARKAKKELDDLAEQAMDVVESGDLASIGTSMHHVHERIDRGLDPGHVPDEYRADVEVYREITRYFRMVSIERFVVQDEHKVAGTLDRAAEVLVPLPLPSGRILLPGEVVILDEKTAQRMDFAGIKFAIQGWTYATGEPYDPVRKERVPWGHATPRQDVALIVHVPSGKGEAAIYEIDLEEAAEAAQVARQVYDWRNSRGKKTVTRAPSHDDMLTEWAKIIGEAPTLAALTELARQAAQLGIWCDQVRELFTARKTALSLTLVETEKVPA